MLAYVFWHRPREGVDGAEYERALQHFHARLGEEPLEGVHGSAAYALGDVAWLGGAGYEDWYFVEASFALDTLNAAAVGASLAAAHAAVAAMTGPMTAGLYRLTEGTWRRQMVLGPVPELADPAAAASGRRPIVPGP